jgi:hypothetical protein
MKGEIDTMKAEKTILEQNMKAMSDVVRSLERHSMEYNNELS